MVALRSQGNWRWEGPSLAHVVLGVEARHTQRFRTEALVPKGCAYNLPGGSAGKESTCNAGDPGSIPWLGRYPGEGKGYSSRRRKESDTTEPHTHPR